MDGALVTKITNANAPRIAWFVALQKVMNFPKYFFAPLASVRHRYRAPGQQPEGSAFLPRIPTAAFSWMQSQAASTTPKTVLPSFLAPNTPAYDPVVGRSRPQRATYPWGQATKWQRQHRRIPCWRTNRRPTSFVRTSVSRRLGFAVFCSPRLPRSCPPKDRPRRWQRHFLPKRVAVTHLRIVPRNRNVGWRSARKSRLPPVHGSPNSRHPSLTSQVKRINLPRDPAINQPTATNKTTIDP